MKRLAIALIAFIGLTGCINKPQVELIQVTEAEKITVTEAQTETELESVELTTESETESNSETEIATEAHRIAANEFSETEQVNYQPETETANISQNLANESISQTGTQTEAKTEATTTVAASYSQLRKVPETEALQAIALQTEAPQQIREPDAEASYSQVRKVPETEALKAPVPQTEAQNQLKEYTPPVTDEASEAVYAAPIEDEYSEKVNHDEAAADASRAEVSDTWEYCGSYRITAYMWTGYRMANGEWPDLGWCATGDEFPFGTVLYIDGYGYYTVGDRGVYNGQVDLYMGTYEACMTVGLQYRDVWRVR